jgi:hypothetical protein
LFNGLIVLSFVKQYLSDAAVYLESKWVKLSSLLGFCKCLIESTMYLQKI